MSRDTFQSMLEQFCLEDKSQSADVDWDLHYSNDVSEADLVTLRNYFETRLIMQQSANGGHSHA